MWKISKRACGILFCLCFCGCIFIPKYQRPALPVPHQFPYASAGNPGAGGVYDLGWKEFFRDPRLRRLLELALKNNRDLRTALLNVEEIRAQYRIVRYGLLPSFAAEAPVNLERQLATSSKYVTLHDYQADVNTSYEIDLFGHIRSLKAQVLEQYLATGEASRSAQITLVASVAQQYLAERSLDEQLELLDQTLRSVESYYKLVEQSFRLGNASALDVEQVRTQIAAAKANIAGYQRQLDQAHDALALLIGGPIPEDLPKPQRLEAQRLIEDLPPGLSSDLIERRPDILEAEHQLKSANANIGVVRATFFPSITLTALDGTASTSVSKLFTHGTGVWDFAPQISLPLFNQNTNWANLDAAQVSKNIQIAQYEKAIETAFQEVSDALAARDTYNRQLTAQRELVVAQQERYNLSGIRYRHGVDSYLTVLLAQQDLYNARANLIQVSLARLSNLISLYKALGGGWKE
jgi:multidrug efflux system outer membrane protein